MARPENKSYFPLRRQLPEHKELNRKQVSAVKRALAKHGRKLPKVGYCALTTKVGGKFVNIVGSTQVSTSEICHEVRRTAKGVKHVYVMRSKPARSRKMWR